MDFNTLDWMLALLPTLAVLGLMVILSWSARQAGLVGWLLALGLAAWRFGAGADALGYAQVKALLLTADVSLIIWAALLLYTIVDRAGALAVIANALSGLTSDTMIQVLLLGWVFTSFLQGVGGFGVPVAIVAPLLIGLGVPQVRAVVIPSLGHSWAVTFGSLAASFVMLTRTVDMPGEELAPAPAIMLGVLCYVTGLMSAHAFDGWRGVRRALPFVLVAGTAMSGAQYILATNGLWTIGAIGGGLAGLVVSILWIRRNHRPVAVATPDSTTLPAPTNPDRPLPSVRLALAGYAILVMLALLLRGVGPVKEFLGRWAVAVDLPATTTDRDYTAEAVEDAGFDIPAHPGIVILYSAAIAYVLYRRRGLYAPGTGREILAQSGRRALRSALGVFMMVAIAATMARSGMIDILADGMSRSIPGDLYAFVAPLLGALGAFVTGSNVNSNAVFGELQRSTAQLLGLSVVTILGAQTSAAAVISMLSPAKVAVGCSTVDANEGVVLRWLLGYGAVVILLIGVMAWIRLHVG
ncbi:MAG: L-lactate permease [Anaerolineae bacterium]|nr:L-lactate permease [Anaerolineae bacterium]